MTRRILFSKLCDKKGSLLIISYLVIVVLLTLGAAFIVVSVNESRIAERQRRTTLTLHIAEAGIERALYDLRQDFVNDTSSPSWADGGINGFAIGPDTANFYSIAYSSTSLNGGSYAVQLKNVSGAGDAIWIKSTGTLGDVQQTIQVYAKIINVSPWNNAIFAGAGASGAMVNGNVNIRGSVHILGTGLQSSDLAVDLGGTAELIGNNYEDLVADLKAKVPALPTTLVGGETVETLSAVLRVKRGIVGLSGSSGVGEANDPGDDYKETVDGTFVTDGWGGTQGTTNVHSDNGTTNAYDLGDTVSFPSLSDVDDYDGDGDDETYQGYLEANALVISDSVDLDVLADIDPNSNFSFSNANGSISMDGNGNLTISGIVYLDNGGNLNMSVDGSDKTITYAGSGSILAEGSVQIDVNLVTNGNNSFPINILGVMTPNIIGFNEANIDVMGLFYAENQVVAEKQTDIVGTIVSNYFDMGTNVPSIYQVPDTINYLPAGMLGQGTIWVMKTVSWQKL
ncbi:MAG: hypothetical protein A3G91_00825 [Omnitrophica WOR_2 bacterium RIFCSPLOWO2_12_FULL_50_9]|nr:MAG: hypothetical protein A3D87_02790 [Omnitrophica WOR_2 bacterium RIFCSPHIGHO2_02_FULL_50_17]OGX43449.1 MAG: hypothetical protein A3G91_00825 [Omnitrophica WOR_2 bacterium RIFCSPLOWO2_12_FULL_50_9]